jgi:hypothetical protein
MPRSRPRRASSSNAIILAIAVWSSGHGRRGVSAARTQCSARLGARDGRPARAGLTVPTSVLSNWHSKVPSANSGLALGSFECKLPRLPAVPCWGTVTSSKSRWWHPAGCLA